VTTNFADISHHNGTPDLAAYKAAGHERIVIKATEGTGFIDPMFKRNWQLAGKVGLRRVAYHFARAKFNGADEFDFFYKVVQDAGGFGERDSACLDVEDPDTPTRAAAEAREFATRAAAKGVTNGLIYTYNYYGVHEHISPTLFPAGWRHMWMADYTVGQADSDIELGAGWTRDQVVARQYTDKAIVAGIGSTDYSRLEHEWLTAVDAVSTTEDEVTPEQMKTLLDAINHSTYILMYGDHAADVNGADAHPNDLQRIRYEMAQDRAAVAAKFAALMEALKTATGGVVNLSDVEAAAEKGAADALARVQLTVAPEAAA
jgi:lysozyme